MAQKTDFPENEGARTTNLTGDILVYMPRCYIRAPVSTLQHQTEDGGMNFIDITAKFCTVFLTNLVP
jgi:hypothetical protein